jgi:hypothetical protein
LALQIRKNILLENITVTLKTMQIRFKQNILDTYLEELWAQKSARLQLNPKKEIGPVWELLLTDELLMSLCGFNAYQSVTMGL